VKGSHISFFYLNIVVSTFCPARLLPAIGRMVGSAIWVEGSKKNISVNIETFM